MRGQAPRRLRRWQDVCIAGDGLAVARHAPSHRHEPGAERIAPGADPVVMKAGVKLPVLPRRAYRIPHRRGQEPRFRGLDKIKRRKLLVEEGAAAQLGYCKHIQYRSAARAKRQAARDSHVQRYMGTSVG